jgi:hypothetical protein
MIYVSFHLYWPCGNQNTIISDCYFFLTDVSGHTSKNNGVEYPYLPSALRPVPHSEELPLATISTKNKDVGVRLLDTLC